MAETEEIAPPLPSAFTGAGLVDLQVNGYGGFDFNGDPADWTPEDWHGVRRKMARHGVMASLPTLITGDAERMAACAARYAAIVAEDAALARAFPKMHIEGPFISPLDGPRGAHPKKHARTPAEMPDLMNRLRDASGGRLGIVTLAPELPGALGLIEALSADGVCVAIGHTNATPEEIIAAAGAGAKMSTHLGNGSHQVLPRMENYLQAQLAEDRLWASFIPDGHHVPLYALKNFIRAKGLKRSILVTDAIAAAGCGPGRYRLGDSEVVVTSALRASIPGQPNLAGAAYPLDRGILNVVRYCGVTFAQAWAMASTQPAALAGLEAPEEITVSVSETGFSVEAA